MRNDVWPRVKSNWGALIAPFQQDDDALAQSIWQRSYFVLIGATIILSLLLALILDNSVYQWARASDTGYIRFHKWITDAGKSEWTLVPSGVFFLAVLVWRSQLAKKIGENLDLIAQHCAFIFFTGAASGILCNVLKNFIGRARPKLYETEGVWGFSPFHFDSSYQSWPSGHSTTVAAFCAWVAFTFPAARIVMIPTAALFCLSRVFANKHYLSDVFAGYVLGFLFVLICARWAANKGMLYAHTNSAFIMEPKTSSAEFSSS